MSNTLRALLTGLTLTLILTGCGESFQATFQGQGKVSPAGCGGVNNGPYDMEVNVSISDNSAEMYVTKFISTITNGSDNSTALVSAPRILASLSGTDIKDVNQIFANDDVTRLNVSAKLAADRSEMTAFEFVYTSVFQGADCTFRVTSDKMTKKN